MSTGPVVFHLDDARSWRGGQQQVLYLHQGALAAGVDSRVICRRGSALHERLGTERLPHYALDLAGPHDLFAARRIGALARSAGGILHAHTSHAHDLGLWASRLGGLPGFVVSRRVDFAVGLRGWSRRKYRSKRVDRYLAISSAVRRELERGGVEAARIVDVPSGIDLSRFAEVEADHGWRRAFVRAPGEILFGSVAALAPHKDQRTLLRAFARYLGLGGEASLVVLGEGAERRALEGLRHELGLDDRVHLPGFTEQVLPKLAAMDVFVLSSEEEGLGTSLLDAMALGRPIVATRAGGIGDAVRDGVNGRLVDVHDVEGLARALLELQRDANLRRALGERGRVEAERFDVRRTVQATLEVYRQVLAEGPR